MYGKVVLIISLLPTEKGLKIPVKTEISRTKRCIAVWAWYMENVIRLEWLMIMTSFVYFLSLFIFFTENTVGFVIS